MTVGREPGSTGKPQELGDKRLPSAASTTESKLPAVVPPATPAKVPPAPPPPAPSGLDEIEEGLLAGKEAQPHRRLP